LALGSVRRGLGLALRTEARSVVSVARALTRRSLRIGPSLTSNGVSCVAIDAEDVRFVTQVQRLHFAHEALTNRRKSEAYPRWKKRRADRAIRPDARHVLYLATYRTDTPCSELPDLQS
jgi:hypothetical protein